MQHHPTLPHDTPSLAKPESEADAVLILSPRDLCTSRLSPDDFHPYNRFLKEASAVFARMLDQNCQEWIHFYQHVTEFTQCRPSLAVRYRSLWERSWSEQDLITRWADQMQLCSSSTPTCFCLPGEGRKGQRASLWPLGESLFPCNANHHLSTWRVFFLLFPPKTNTPELSPSPFIIQCDMRCCASVLARIGLKPVKHLVP